MKLYKAKVNIGGVILNQVMKDEITAAEIHVLKRIHGEDAVAEIVEVGEVKGRTDAAERERLANIYRAGGPDIDGKNRVAGKRFVEMIFGVAGTPLPHVYEAATVPGDEEYVVATETIVRKDDKPKKAVGEVVVPNVKRTKVTAPAEPEAAALVG